MQLLNGADVARAYYAELEARIRALAGKGIQPGLATLLVGEDAASRVYVRNKLKRCEAIGVRGELHELPATSSQAEVLDAISRLNDDSRVHGVIVQLPVPKHLDARRIMQAVALEKDVDGFNWWNLGAVVDDQVQFAPCTPAAVVRILDHAGIQIAGRRVVVIGRSTIVGKPVALMLITRDATVTVCHSKTPDLGSVTREADIVVAAAGRPRLVTGDMIKRGAAVIDVGINRLASGQIVGDVDFDSVKAVAGALTPVPGGVGPMTVAMLIGNTVLAAERRKRE